MNKKTQALVEQYSSSLVEVAIQRDCVQSLQSEVEALVRVFEETQLQKVLENIALSRDKKISLVRLFQESSSEYMKNFLEVILQNEREVLLEAILNSILDKFITVTNTYDVEVITVVDLTDTQKKALSQLISKKFTIKVNRIIEKIDPSLIGGFILNANNKVIDTSIKTQLQQLKMNLK